MDKMISNLADLPLDLLEDLHLWYWNLVVMMISNLADLSLDLQADLPLWYWHVMVKMSSSLADLPLDLLTEQSLPVLTSCGQHDFKFHRCNPKFGFRSTPWYLDLVVKMSSDLEDLPLDLLEDAPFQDWHLVVKMSFKFGRSTTLVLTSDSQDEFKYGRSTAGSAGRSTPQALTSHGQEWVQIWQIYPQICWQINTPHYWYLMVKMSSNLAGLPLDQLADLPPDTYILWPRSVQI